MSSKSSSSSSTSSSTNDFSFTMFVISLNISSNRTIAFCLYFEITSFVSFRESSFAKILPFRLQYEHVFTLYSQGG
ncbi:hypothetical protein NY2A_b198R [Paramecium bursaria Chlorella virus NY2A]|uniref:Uncharacterized protein b198R n=1 Tax=Paramecium bursaria Chlorella virus NY2A TaxID=46021 RepID=A7IW73_PBCVN|nr:hypothetical protein NY2A_b198R [Paramecium bursaria Chlorella virus NY2A]YP_001498270.1 hypothetical protein AR158_c188R [Paramecium bursaria Chlorella virus AR158]ABT14597.1 hypothetical protein NY2A_b198R [Paramecium bursaria Chlorella virus NY2A]ABU43734.1 hypothetical protein AR158_c188R [Paramecium bursaria Chlorella virus AR158]